MSTSPKPVALIILDGFGEREDAQDNAITVALGALFIKTSLVLIKASKTVTFLKTQH